MRRVCAGFLLAPLLLIGGAGCGGGKTVVTRHPNWDYEQYERLAVTPGTAADQAPQRDCDRLADLLTTQLANNGAFRVSSRQDLKRVMTEQDLARLSGVVDQDTAPPEGKIEIAQALVIPRLTHYRLIAEKVNKERPVYRLDRHGRPILDRSGRPVIAGVEVVPIFTHGAEVQGTVNVIDVGTGRILMSYTTQPIAIADEQAQRPPDQTPEDMAAGAIEELALEMYNNIAPIHIAVKLKKDMIVVATDYFDGRYEESSKLSSSLPEFLLAVRGLPPECDRNPFRIAVAAEDTRQNLFEADFVWSPSLGKAGAQHRVPIAALLDSGATKFVAKLYSGNDPEPILTRDFSLAVSKEERRDRSSRNAADAEQLD